MDRLLFWLLFPLVAPQALMVRRNAPRFAAANGPAHGEVGQGRHFNLLAVGDSIVAGVGARRLEKALVGCVAERLSRLLNGTVAWRASGSIGAGSGKVLRRLASRMPQSPMDFIIVSVGVNDVTAITRVSTWTANLETMAVYLRAHSSDAVIAFGGVPPMHRFPLLPQPLRQVLGLRATILDRAAQRVIRQRNGMVHVPLPRDLDATMFSADGYHPSENGYAHYGARVADALVHVYRSRF